LASLPKPTKDGKVTVYTVEVYYDERGVNLQVPLQDKDTRLVVKVIPRPILFSL